MKIPELLKNCKNYIMNNLLYEMILDISHSTEEQQLAQQAGLPTYSCKVSIRRKDDRAKLPGTACPDCARVSA